MDDADPLDVELAIEREAAEHARRGLLQVPHQHLYAMLRSVR